MGRRGKLARVMGLGVAGLVLAGCGHSPGTAFSVGDTVVRTTTVDQIVDAACGVSQQTKSARSKQVWAFVNALLTATVENRYGDHVGATYDSATLQQEISQYAGSIASLPAKDRKVVRTFLTDQIRGALIVQSVGKKALAAKGVPSPTQAEITNAGTTAAQRWARKEGITVDPRYNPGGSHAAGAGDGSISTPVSSYAKAAVKGSASASYLAQLPAVQLCG